MALRWNAQTNRFEEVGGLVGNYNGTNLTQNEFNAIKQSGVTDGLASTVVTDGGNVVNSGGFLQGLKDAFTPQGPAGTSTGGNIMSAIGTGVGVGTGLAGAYFAKKNYDLQKDQQDYLRNREAASDARKTQFAANAGGGASY